MPVEKEIAVLYCGTHGLLRNVPIDKVPEFEKTFLKTLELNHQTDVLDVLKTGEFNKEIAKKIEETAEKAVKLVLS